MDDYTTILDDCTFDEEIDYMNVFEFVDLLEIEEEDD